MLLTVYTGPQRFRAVADPKRTRWFPRHACVFRHWFLRENIPLAAGL